MLKPDLQFSVLCDDVRREMNGKFILIGLFEAIAAPQYPMQYGQLHVINRWCNGQGEFRQKVRIIAPDDKIVCETQESPVALPQTTASLTAHSIIRNIPFEKPGRYWIEILLDGDLKQRYPLMVAEIKPVEGHPGFSPGPGVG